MTGTAWEQINADLQHAEGLIIAALKHTPQKHRPLRARLAQIQRAIAYTRQQHMQSY